MTAPRSFRRPMLALLVLAMFALAVLWPAQAAPQALGTDPVGDDTAALTYVSDPVAGLGTTVPCPTADDCTNIDDLVGMSVSTGTNEVLFRLDVQERPEDSENLIGVYCWMAAFQVDGDEEEFLGLSCTDYGTEGGEGTAVEEDSSRGTEVASSMEWVEGAAAVVIHVPFDAIGAGIGTKLVDLYGLTYLSGNLVVDDAMPDAKSDRAATESLGSFVIGSDTGAATNVTSNTTSGSGSGSASGSGSGSASPTGTKSVSGSGSKSGSVSGGGADTSGNATGNGTDEGKKDAPSLAVPVLLGTVALLAVVRRRL